MTSPLIFTPWYTHVICRWTTLTNVIIRLFWRIFEYAKPPVYDCSIDGVTFSVRRNSGDRFVIHEVWRQHGYPLPKPGDIVVDAGANIGAYSVYAAKAGATVIAIEPESENYRCVSRNTRPFPNITALQLALGNKSETRFLGNRRKFPSTWSFYEISGVPVECVTVDDLLKLQHLTHIDLLKLDVEGAEHEILPSLTPGTFQCIDTIAMEFHDWFVGTDYTHLVRILEEQGFVVTVQRSLRYWFMRTGYLYAERLATAG